MSWNGQSTGYGAIVAPDSIVQSDSLTCSHCQQIAFSGALAHGKTFDEQGKKCLGCNKWICKRCTKQQSNGGGCKTYEQIVDELERAFQKNRSRDELLRAAFGD